MPSGRMTLPGTRVSVVLPSLRNIEACQVLYNEKFFTLDVQYIMGFLGFFLTRFFIRGVGFFGL